MGAELARRVALVAAVASLAGCILLVSPRDYGEHCKFGGEATACGQCIAQSCQAVVDTCCRNDSCTPGLNLVEHCASGEQTPCELLQSDLQATDPHRVELARCVSTQCAATCKGEAPTTNITKCSSSSFGLGNTCSCSVTADPNGVACSEAAFPLTRCCAPQTWPAAGQKCTCEILACTSTTDGCACLLYDGPAESSMCTDAICCLDHDSCRCGSKPCGSSSTQVPSCNLAAMECPPAQKHVASCTATAP